MTPTTKGLYWVSGYGLAIVGEFTDPQSKDGSSRWLICTRTDHIPLGDRRAWLIWAAPNRAKEGE